MNEWLASFANPNFMPHGHCYMWQPEILWTHVVSDLTIAIAYYAIPIVLGIFLFKRRNAFPFPELIGLFVAFIFLCGTTHLFAIYVTWHPAYEQQGWLKAMTALVSIATALVLAPRLPALITLPGIQAAYEQSERTLKAVESEKAEMQSIHDLAIDRENRIIELKEEVNQLLVGAGAEPKYLKEVQP